MQELKYSYPERRYYHNNAQSAPIDAQRRFLELRKRNALKKSANTSPAKMIAVLVWMIALAFSFIVNKQNFLDPVYLNRINNRGLNFEAEKVYKPTLNYAHNLNFMGQNILTSIPKKGKERVVTIHSKGELSGLRNEIEFILKKYPKLRAGVYIYDYKSGNTVEINSDEVFPAASIIKIPVLLDLFNRSKNLEKEGYSPLDVNKKLTFTEAHRAQGSGNLQYKPANVDYSIDYLAKTMIRQSDNSATNMLIEYNGGINETNASLRHWGFSKTQVSNFLPDLDGTNLTTPKDIATMLYNIDNQAFLSTRYSAYIKDYMSRVDNRTLIKSQIPSDAVIVHKTGDIGKMLGDAAIVYSPSGSRYIMVMMVKRPHNDYSARDLIQKTAKVTYETLGK